MSDLVHPLPAVPLELDLAQQAESAAAYAAAARSEKTRSTYAGEWRAFLAWCLARSVGALPAAPEVVALYLSARADAGRKAAGIELALTAISQAHKTAGLSSPRKEYCVAQVRAGIRRTHGTAQEGRRPLTLEALRRVLEPLGDRLLDTRDRAMLLVGWAGALRRSELAALNMDDVEVRPEGLVLTLRRSKTDQEGAGRRVPIPRGRGATCPVAAHQRWLSRRGDAPGALFLALDRWGRPKGRLRGADVALVVKRRAEAVGLDASRLSGHSLRSGLATSAARAGKSERSIMAVTGHTSERMVRRYIKEASLFSDLGNDGIGL